MTEITKVTFRKRGKAHRGLLHQNADGRKWLRAACCCPGSNRGTLTNGAVIIGEGWERATCRNNQTSWDNYK